MIKWNNILLILTICFISCNDFQGEIGASSSMQESKKRNVFVSEYTVNPNPYIINDSLKINVTKAWVEKKWAYGESESKTIIINRGYQLIIRTSKTNLKNYMNDWMIGTDGDRYIRDCADDCLMSDFAKLPDSVERWKVQNGNHLDSSSKKIIMGKFEVHKK